jgi:peptidoglycan/LPS O-acetylase OafA/YrhL
MFSYTFWGRCIEFFTGIALALFYKKAPLKTKYATLVGVINVLICLYMISILKGHNDFGIRHPLGILINNIFLPLFGISILFWGVLTENTWLQRILSSKPFILLGKSSYIFYLIHLGVIYDMVNAFTTNVFFSFMTINLISIILFKTGEEPLNYFIKRKFLTPYPFIKRLQTHY